MSKSLTHRFIKLLAAGALAFGFSSAFAQLSGSDAVTVYDGNGDVVEYLEISEADELANGPGHIYMLQTRGRLDVGPTTLYDDPLNPAVIGDIFGAVADGGNIARLAFASDTEGVDLSQFFGTGAFSFYEGGALEFDMTSYLALDLQQLGYTAFFRSDAEPLPEPMPLALLALAGAGLLVTRRKQA